MSSDFSYVRLADYTDKIGSGSTPRGGSSVYLKTGQFTLFRSQNIYNNGFSLNGLVYITVDAADKLKSVSIQEDDILLNITGDSVARVCIAPKELLPARVNQHVSIIRVNKTEFDSKYLRYFLSSPRMQKTMLSLASTGGTRNALTKSMIENFDVPKPLLQEQQKIASILSSLDDKIELNNKMNQTLEKMAQTIFKEWFEEFNFPNAEGKPYKTNGGAMHPSELGEIPEGWEVKEISTLFSVKDGTHDSPKNQKNGYPLVTSKHIKNNQLNISNTNLISQEDYKKINKRSLVETNDILIGMIGTVGDLCLVTDSPVNYAIKNIGLFKTSERVDLVEYIFYRLSSLEMKQHIISRLAGTTQKYISLTELRKIPIIVPDKITVAKFKIIIENLLLQIKQNQQQTQTLTKLRDTLLPKLMSGEIKV